MGEDNETMGGRTKSWERGMKRRGKENDTTRNSNDDEGGKWNDDTAGRPSTSTGR